MQVPIAQTSIRTEVPGTVTPAIEPATSKAFGADVGAAQAGVGGALVTLGEQVSRRIQEKDNFDKEQAVHDALQPVQQDMYQKTQGADGYATLQGVKAKGATERFDAEYQPKKAEFVKQFSDPRQAALAGSQYDSIFNNHRDAVISNEGHQTSIAEQQGLSSGLFTAVQAASVNPKQSPFEDPGVLAAMGRSYDYDKSVYGEQYAEQEKQKANDVIARERLKLFPQDADKMLGQDLTADGKAATYGAKLDYAANTIQSGVSGMNHPDGSANIGAQEQAAREKASDMGIDDKDIPHIVNFVRSSALAHDQQLSDAREAMTRKFYDDAITQKQNNVPYEAAFQMLKQKNYAYDPKDLQEKQDWLTALYTKDTDIYSKVMEHWTKAQHTAFDQIRDSKELSEKYPDTHDQKRYMDNFMQQIIEKHSSQPTDMNQIFKDDMSTIPTGRFKWFGLKGETEAKSDVVSDLQEKNMTLVSALGIDNSVKLAQDMGGPEKLGNDTSEGKAALFLAQSKKPVTKANINFLVSTYPDKWQTK